LWRYALQLRIEGGSFLHSKAWFGAQALVRLYLDLHEKHAAGVLREKLKYDDIVGTIKLLVNDFPASMNLLSVRRMFKRQQDNFDKILKVTLVTFRLSVSLIHHFL